MAIVVMITCSAGPAVSCHALPRVAMRCDAMRCAALRCAAVRSTLPTLLRDRYSTEYSLLLRYSWLQRCPQHRLYIYIYIVQHEMLLTAVQCEGMP